MKCFVASKKNTISGNHKLFPYHEQLTLTGTKRVAARHERSAGRRTQWLYVVVVQKDSICRYGVHVRRRYLPSAVKTCISKSLEENVEGRRPDRYAQVWHNIGEVSTKEPNTP